MMENISGIAIIITAAATVALAVITYFYVKATNRYAKTADIMLKVSDTPKVQVDLTHRFQSHTISTLDLCIQNIGTGFAYDIKFTGNLFSIIPFTSETPLAEYSIIKNGVSFLGPGKRYQIPILWQVKKDDLPKGIFRADVTYRDSANKERKEQYNLEFTKFQGYTQMGDPSIEDMARSLQHIAHVLADKMERDNQNQQR